MLEAFERPEFAAFGNHLAFLGKHRGRLNVDASGWTLTGASDELSCWTPRTDTMAVPSWCKAVRLAPWAGAVWDECLPRAGFAPGERLAYMELERLVLAHRTAGDVTIEVARSGTALREFAAVQAAGFATGDAAVDDWWRPFFTEVALANRLDAEQSFYLARVGDEAAATTLVVRAAGVAGIYAVATRPEFRRVVAALQAGALMSLPRSRAFRPQGERRWVETVRRLALDLRDMRPLTGRLACRRSR